MNAPINKRLFFLGVILIFFCTCKQDNYEPLGYGFVIPTLTYNNTINGYIYLNCSKTPAVNYPVTLYNYVALTTYYTDNTGHYSIPFTYTAYEGMWTPQEAYNLYLASDSISVELPQTFDYSIPIYNSSYDTNITINQSNIVLNDSAHYRAVFKFTQSYTSNDTLYYVLYANHNYTPSYIVGPFPSRLAINFNIPLKYVGFSINNNTNQFNYGLGINNLNSGKDIQSFYYKACSSTDSLVVTYY